VLCPRTGVLLVPPHQALHAPSRQASLPTRAQPCTPDGCVLSRPLNTDLLHIARMLYLYLSAL